MIGIPKSILLIGLCWMFDSYPAQSAEDGATKPPEFRRHSSDQQVAEALKASKAEEKLADLAARKGNFPDRGAYITSITKESPFSKLGIPVGSVMMQQGDTLFLSLPLKVGINPEQNGDILNRIVWVSHDNQYHETDLPPEGDGAYIRSYRNLVNYYLRYGQRGAKWDTYVVAALDHQGKDPMIAETCWAKAFSEGYKHDKLSSCSGMHLALDRQEFELAAAFAGHFTPYKMVIDLKHFPLQFDDIYKVALMTGDPKWYEQVNDLFSEEPDYARHLPNFRKQIELAAEVPKGTPPPSELAAKMERTSFLVDADTNRVPWCKNAQRGVLMHEWAAMAHMKGDQKVPEHRFETSLDHFATYFFSPSKPSRDLDVEIRFRFEPKPAPPDQVQGFNRVFVFGLADRNAGGVRDIGPYMDSRILLASLNFGASDSSDIPAWEIGSYGKVKAPMLRVWQGLERNPSPLVVPSSMPYRHDPKHVYTLRIVRVGSQAEAILDGKRLALVHVPSDLKNPGLHFRVVGCRVTIVSLTADTLK